MSRHAEDTARELRVALLSEDPSLRSLVRSSVESSLSSARIVCDAEVSVAGLTQKSVDKLLSYRPDLLFVDLGERTAAGTRFIAALTARSPMAVVAAGEPLGADELLALVRAGAVEYLPRPVDAAEVASSCARVVRRLERGPSGAEERGAGRVIAVFSPKGGTGVTTVAVNLAVHIRSATGKQVLLLDLSDDMGDAAVHLGIEHRYSYLDVVESLHRMDERLLDSFLEEHETGVRLLGAPVDVERGRGVAPERIAQLMTLVARYSDYAVVDLGRGLDRAARAALGSADERLLLATPDLPTLRNVKRILAEVEAAGSEPRETPAGDAREGARLVVNRSDAPEGLSHREIERAIGLPVFHGIPRDDGPVLRSVNLGRPAVCLGSCAFSTGVAGLGDRLAADDLPRANGRRPLGRLIRAVLNPFSGNGTQGRPSAGRRGTSRRPDTGRVSG